MVIKNWRKVDISSEMWSHTEKLVNVFVLPEIDNIGKWRAFVMPETRDKNGEIKSIYYPLARNTSRTEARKKAIAWMKAHPGSGFSKKAIKRDSLHLKRN